ncbi:Cytochrome P450 1A1 [Termitomyces sp. J132]|nr:Cytochrome P450 1A1 [Termitomyces sp. J132]
MSHVVRILVLIASAVIALFKFLHLHRWRVKIHYPPGPKGFPIIGNLLDIPTSFQWNTYSEWAKKYGDLIHINVLGVHLIIINSEDIANELIEKRSSNYNDRPEITVMTMGMLDRMQSIPFDSVKYHMAQDTAVQSWVCELLQRNATKGEEVVPEAVIKALGASTFAEAQKRAQAEIDEVIGNKRLPTFDDRMSLPYCVPHSTVVDDIYNGYLIPKGSIVIMNQWAMWRDQRVYDVLDEFRPERFLNVYGTLNNMFPPTFGFGRRACVGKSMADASTWIALVSMLSVFHITKAKDAAGNDIEVPESYGDGIVR